MSKNLIKNRIEIDETLLDRIGEILAVMIEDNKELSDNERHLIYALSYIYTRDTHSQKLQKDGFYIFPVEVMVLAELMKLLPASFDGLYQLIDAMLENIKDVTFNSDCIVEYKKVKDEKGSYYCSIPIFQQIMRLNNTIYFQFSTTADSMLCINTKDLTRPLMDISLQRVNKKI